MLAIIYVYAILSIGEGETHKTLPEPNKMYIKRFSDKVSVILWSENTRTGFRHIAVLCFGGYEVDRTKCTYINRTWERYQFESVLLKIADSKKLSAEEREEMLKIIKN